MEEKKMQYLFGMHPVLEAVKAGKKFDKVLLKQGLEGAQFRELMELLKINEIPFQFVPGERLNRAVRGSHQGVLAYISQIDYVDIETLVNNALAMSDNPLLVILDGALEIGTARILDLERLTGTSSIGLCIVRADNNAEHILLHVLYDASIVSFT